MNLDGSSGKDKFLVLKVVTTQVKTANPGRGGYKYLAIEGEINGKKIAVGVVMENSGNYITRGVGSLNNLSQRGLPVIDLNGPTINPDSVISGGMVLVNLSGDAATKTDMVLAGRMAVTSNFIVILN